ncbi:histidine phosphatase family protein [Pseudokineococcus lusitanus]|uniref:Broad specificity phosphatase PhoE n=1 Tax=Pseudokineococcus lusitanus TaxID=763993 RepID=A0A3N1HMJ0_9ACTN|nr:histidine phosphatase family protein [Pseudokineococcus lusitanus]ROP43728.1 broad specificity phosphatase PhoE [Pseudokineococcus lusitanus]
MSAGTGPVADLPGPTTEPRRADEGRHVTLHLVRHGAPLVDPAQAPSSWSLDPSKVDAVHALRDAGVLPPGARWVSSAEPKARETAALLTDEPVGTDADLREQARPAGWLDDYAVRIHRSLVALEHPSAPGWETGESTRERVVTAALTHLDAAGADGHRDLVLVGHGTAWTLLVAALTGRPVDLYAWERLTLPDVCVVAGGELVRRWGAWRAQPRDV